MMINNRVHLDEKFFVRHTHPAKSKSRAVVDFHAKHDNENTIKRYDPNSLEWDDVKYPARLHEIENDVIPSWYLEKHDFSLSNTPQNEIVYLTPQSARVAMARFFLDRDRELTTEDIESMVGPIKAGSHAKSRLFDNEIKPIFKKLYDHSFPEPSKVTTPCEKDRTKTCCIINSFDKICACGENTQELEAKSSGHDRIPRCIQDMKHLEKMVLNSSINIIDNLDGLSRLTLLDLRNNNIAVIENIDEIESIKILELRDNRIKTVENLEPLQFLDIIDLHSNKMERDDSLDGLIPVKSLRRAVISNNEITNDKNVLNRIKERMQNTKFKFLGLPEPSE